MTASKIGVRLEGSVAVLTLEDGKANTFERGTFEGLERALEEISTGPAGALLVTGRPGFLSAGLDLKILPAAPRPERVETIRAFGRAMLALFMFPKPAVAAITGHALGAGAILALATDVRLCVDGAFRFGMNEVPIGMVVPTFGVEIARSAATPATLAEMLLHGRIFSPAELLARGLVEASLAPDTLFAAALRRATALADLPGTPYRETKRRLRGESARIARACLDDESETLVAAWD